MAVVTGDRYLEKLVHFVEQQAGSLIDGSLVLKLNPAGFHYVNSRLEALHELESLLAGAPVDYLRAYVSDLGDHRALEQLRRILRLLTSLKVVSVLPSPARDPTPLSFRPFGRLRVLELRGCDLSTSAAKGLLELRHTLEKIICHNSTDALRHVFASRIAEIKDSPQWNRLSFVSCACNGLVLMDESLQLLPAVETLDLSRNKFAIVDNLRKCVKLKHLDLGFNQLRTISSFSQKKVSRLASIVNEEENTCSDQDSVSCDNEIQSREEVVISDNEAEIVDLMTRVELMKKERSVLWLREFKEWLDHASENDADIGRYSRARLHIEKENYLKTKASWRQLGEKLTHVPDYIQASGDESSTNVLESDSSFLDISSGHAHHFDQIVSTGNAGRVSPVGMDSRDLRENLKAYSHEGTSTVSSEAKSFRAQTFTTQGGHRMIQNLSMSALSVIDDISESYSSSANPGSPPHYQKDILCRRHNLEEEILQLSAESYSVASSDSNTSCSEDENYESMQSVPENWLNESAVEYPLSNRFKYYDIKREVDRRSVGVSASDVPADAHDVEINNCINEECDFLERRKGRQKTKRRVTALLEDDNMIRQAEPAPKSNGILDNHVAQVENKQDNQYFYGSGFHEVNKRQMLADRSSTPLTEFLSSGNDEFIENYFNTNVADSRNHEICKQCLCCCCILELDFFSREREVAVVLSSEDKLYILLIGVVGDGSGTMLKLKGCHRVEDIREVVVGIGLQVVRVYVGGSATYVFKTRSIEKSRQLLSTLKAIDSFALNGGLCLRSLEQVQVELFEKQICGGSKVSIFQYSMVQFWCSYNEGESWSSRSLFVAGGHVFLCFEDLMQFSSLSVDAPLPSYFSLDLCCSIVDISELVVDVRESRCVTLAVECAMSEFCPSGSAVADNSDSSANEKKIAPGSMTWKLRWFSEESPFKFVALLKAIHGGMTVTPLLVRCIS
ncbi:uncharacterized protein LOC126600014 isoform X2 [Malus sylvestris]|uniref:uncharacterized protein LOC126600014 isoform X2 n=1 Tax=Malus sylvestris TaxID=3752 RepID=UPI0021ACF644|nr:uncharacterized protein LOC126600014 isoform X2 [Malus sylvestris]